MHPAFSVIFFTVSSGAGFGLFVLLYFSALFNLGGGLPVEDQLLGLVLSLVLVAAGLMSSTFHLANPRNAWRAFSRWRTSWLSREGVFAVVFFPLAMIHIALLWWGEWVLLRHVVGAAAVLLAWLTLFSTGMIYACLKTIRQWNTPLVPAAYLALGHAVGAVILLVFVARAGIPMTAYQLLAASLILVALGVKGLYFFWVSQVYGSTIQTATGFTRASVKILDAGHTHGTFLTEEFGYKISRTGAWALTVGMFLISFVLPLLLIGLGVGAGAPYAWPVLILVVVGVVVERWLFFAEARHVVNLFHGAQRC
jgi:DMSO reductase anchor subunit